MMQCWSRRSARCRCGPPRGCRRWSAAMAALKLGAAGAQVFDIDPQALRPTKDNAARMGVGDLLEIAENAAARGTADVLLANILAGTLIELAAVLAALVKPGGRIALAGILAEQAPAVAQACAACFDIREAGRLDGWVLLAGTRRQ